MAKFTYFVPPLSPSFLSSLSSRVLSSYLVLARKEQNRKEKKKQRRSSYPLAGAGLTP